ncbi:MAG: efflux RND transporter permease subunit [Alphaproteobacteria bacterium]
MNLIKVAIARPIAVIAAVLMVLLFGYIGLMTIPIQLAPDVREPVITISTIWPGAAPAEVEREIVNKQEEALKGVEGLQRMLSTSQNGSAQITLEFSVGQDMDRALLLVSNRLQRVSGYPDEATEPTLGTSGSDDNPIAWFVLNRVEGNERPIHTYGDLVDDIIGDRLQRVDGISGINAYGGTEREMQVIVDPLRLSQYRLTVGQVAAALRAANASISAGDIDEGKRSYTVRTEGALNDPDQVRAVLVRSAENEAGGVGRVTIGDIAEVGFAYKDQEAIIRYFGEPAIAINAVRDAGANVIETMEAVHAVVDELNSTALSAAGLQLTQVYDETVYINSAIDLVNQNILFGGLLAAGALMIFLRSWRATLVVSLSIPVSVIGSFVVMAALGRSLNVVSLAGIAFAVGMVVDAAIVVLENIYRLRQEGLSRFEAAFKGASQVWGAVLVSALTTVMVFIPILTMELEVGQLFRDIAVAISVSVLLSLVVSITVIPALSNRLLTHAPTDQQRFRLPGIDDFAGAFVRTVSEFARIVVRSKAVALGTVFGIVFVASAFVYIFRPDLDYLPTGNQNFVFGVILPPPGYNLATTAAINQSVEAATRPLWRTESGPEPTEDGLPKFDGFFTVALKSQAFIGGAAVQIDRAGELIGPMQGPVFAEPGTFGFFFQPSLFGRGLGGGRSIDLDISGDDLEVILGVAQQAFGMTIGVLPFEQGHQTRPLPDLTLGAPEVRIYPNRMRLADNGVTALELGQTVDAFNDGLRVDEITVGSERIDLMLIGRTAGPESTQSIAAMPVVTASGDIVPVASVADVQLTAGPTEIRHLELNRTVTLQITPSPAMPLETAINLLREQVVAAIEAQGTPSDVRFNLSGTADKLAVTWDALVVDLMIAVVIVYLVMAVLFESFIYPLIIILSVPVAAAGGLLGLQVLNLYQDQKLDMLTMLGFVILIGIVVNNAILLVHQTLYNIRTEGMDAETAIAHATRNRIRPIFMSTLTSVFGMLPLVVFPGAGSELYRGLGSVVVGGLTLSAVLTLAIVPPLMSLFVATIESRGRHDGEPAARSTPEPGAIRPVRDEAGKTGGAAAAE